MPMEKLLKKDVTFCYNEDCKKSLDVLKEKMVNVLRKEFHLHVNASCIVLGVVLTQDGGEDLDHLISLSKVDKNYSTIKCEWLAMVYAL